MTESRSAESSAWSRESLRATLELMEEPSAAERAAERKAARIRYRTYCIACGRSSEGADAPARLARCEHCGGTMLVEPVTT